MTIQQMATHVTNQKNMNNQKCIHHLDSYIRADSGKINEEIYVKSENWKNHCHA